MEEVFVMFSTPTCRDSPTTTFLPGLEAGPSPCGWQAGPTMSQCGPPASPANHSPAPEREQALTTKGISGPKGTGSPESIALQESLESRLRTQLEKDGSTLFSTAWRAKHTPAGRRYCEHVLLVGQRKGKGSIGLLPTLSAREGRDWSKGRILASLDNGTGVAKRISVLSPPGLLSEEICGLNPSFAVWLMGYPDEWDACMVAAMQSIQESPHSSSALTRKPDPNRAPAQGESK